MFKDHESPISLFSFQDIITCLTGIMLFLLLILSIRIMEIREREERTSPHRAELEELRRNRDLLRRQLADMERESQSYRRRLNAARRMDKTALTIEKERLERELRERSGRLEELRMQTDGLRRQLMAERERKVRLEKLRDAAQEDVRTVAEQEKQIAELRRKLAETRSEIERRRRKLEIGAPPGGRKKTLVLECSGDQIRLIDMKGGNSKTIPRGDSPFFTVMADEALKLLADHSPADCFFVALIKPSAAPYAQYLMDGFWQRFPKADFVAEPILESEACD